MADARRRRLTALVNAASLARHEPAVYVVEDALVLTMMRFADELVDVTKFQFPSAREVRPKELELRLQRPGEKQPRVFYFVFGAWSA